MPDDSKRSNTFEFGASLDHFKNTLARREALPENLDKPLRALVAQLAAMVEKEPLSVYITSEDADREIRDHFAFLLATYLRDREQSTLLIDSDYMSVGLSGLVPQKDALGFLDLLLYGSSLGVITQDGASHLRVIGAGSFPVAKKNPFIMEAFTDAHRYLLSHSNCLLYIGPALDDADEAHPLAGQVELVIAVGRGRRQRIRITRTEDKLNAAVGQRMWHVRIVEPAPARTAPIPEPPLDKPETPPAPIPVTPPKPEPPPVTPEPEPTPVAADDSAGFKDLKKDDTPAPAATIDKLTEPPPPRFDDEPASAEPSANSMLPRIVTFVVGFLVVAFIVWWLYQTKVFRNGSQPPVARAPVQETTPPPEPQADQTDTALTEEPADTQATGPGQVADSEVTTTTSATPGGDTQETDADAGSGSATDVAPQASTDSDPPPDDPVSTEPAATEETPTTTPTKTETQAPAPAREPGVTVTQGLGDFGGAYLVHISSFRELERARVEADQLADKGFAAIVAFVDTGSKGFYHRVYVGPYKYREAARMDKIKLDEIRFVKFTRITKVSE